MAIFAAEDGGHATTVPFAHRDLRRRRRRPLQWYLQTEIFADDDGGRYSLT